MGAALLIFLGSMFLIEYPPNKSYAARVRGEFYGLSRLLIPLIILFAIILDATIAENIGTTSILKLISNIMELIQKPVGIAFGIVFLYSFHKGIAVMQEGVRQWKTVFLRKFFGRILTIARIAGTIAMLAISYVALEDGWMPF